MTLEDEERALEALANPSPQRARAELLPRESIWAPDRDALLL